MIFTPIQTAYEVPKERKHIPHFFFFFSNTKLVNVKLSPEQQIHGLVGVIETQYGMLEVKIPVLVMETSTK